MLFCVFTTLAVLVSVSSDQSGASLAEVTSSFRGTLQDHGRSDVAMIAAAFRQVAAVPDDEQLDQSYGGVNAPRYIERNDQSIVLPEEEETELFSSEELLPTDVNGPVFSHLMTELQRYCKVSPAEELGGQLALDLHSQIPQSEGSVRVAIEKVLRICRKANDTLHRSPAEFEVIVWASTPATDAMATASEDAFTLEQTLERSFKAQSVPAVTISSSGRIWTHPESPRPLATVIVRAAKR
jgi:hypothetical protein